MNSSIEAERALPRPARYLFDRDFDAGDIPDTERVARRMRAERAEEVGRVSSDAFSRGVAQGRAEMMAETDARIADCLTQISARLGLLVDEVEQSTVRLRSESTALAVAAATRLACELVRRQPLAEIEALFSECLAHLDHAPRLTVRVDHSLAAMVEERLTALSNARGFEGVIVVAGEPGMFPGDCRVEWASGGMTRDFGRIAAEIEQAVRRHVQPDGQRREPRIDNGASR